MFNNIIKRQARPLYFTSLSKIADLKHQATNEQDIDGNYDHVLLVCIDALRPDTVPDIPLHWSKAISASTWTFPSVTSFLSGLYPHEHGSIAHTMPEDDEFAIPEQYQPKSTLPAVFEKNGYRTLGLYGFPMPFMASKIWFSKHRVWADEPAETLIKYYESWRDSSDQTFAYIHLADLHAPVKPPKEYVDARNVDQSLVNLPVIKEYTDSFDETDECQYYRKHKLRLYQAAVDYVSDSLKSLTEMDDTLLVVIGDHGEAFWEHYELDRQFSDSRPNYGVGHGGTPFDKVARVPVGTNDDSIKPTGGHASLIDIPSTILQTVFDNSFESSGVCWKNEIPETRSVLCEGVRYGPERKAVYKNDQKLIHSKIDDISLFATVNESGEEFRESVDSTELYDEFPDDWMINNQGEASQAIEDQLKALGYK